MIEHLKYRKDLSLLFNPKTGNMIRLDDMGVEFYECLKSQNFNFEKTASKISKEYNVEYEIVTEDLNEFIKDMNSNSHIDFDIEKRHNTKLSFPLRLEIEVTSLCNWNCGFCYNVWKIDPNLTDKEVKKQIKELPQKNLSKHEIFKVLDEAERNGCFIVRYSGGETLLHPDIKEILEYGGKLGLHQIVFTNGHFINEDIISLFKQNNVGTVLISLHGDKTTHNFLAGHKMAYDKAVNAIELLSKNNIDVVTELTLVKGNTEILQSVLNDAYNRGSRHFSVMRYVPTGKDDEKYAVPYHEIPDLIHLLNKEMIQKKDLTVAWPCGQKMCISDVDKPITDMTDDFITLLDNQFTGSCESGITWGSISFDGHLRNCPHSNVYFGNVKDDSISVLWNNLTTEVLKVTSPREGCIGCNLLDKCKGGCHLKYFFDNNKSKNKAC